MNDQLIFVTVLPGTVDERKGTFTNDKGEEISYETRNQGARLESAGFIYPYDVRLQKDQAAYAPGRYRMCIESMLTVNKNKHGLDKFPILEAAK